MPLPLSPAVPDHRAVRPLLLLALTLFACVDDPAPASDAGEAGSQDPFDAAAPAPPRECNVITDVCVLPFPSALFARPDPTLPSGERIDAARAMGPLWDKLSPRAHDGFSPIGAILTTPSRLLTADDLRADALAPDAPVRLLTLTGDPVPYRAELIGDDRQLLVLTPSRALEPGARYAVVLTTALGPANDAMRALLADEPTPDLADLHLHYGELRALVDAQGIPRDEVGQLWDFRVRSRESATADLEAMVAFNRRWLAEQPLNVDVVGAPREVKGKNRVDVEFDLPIWREAPGALLNRGEDGLPVPLRFDRVRGALIIPPEATPESPAWPVLFGHGLSASAEVMVPLIARLDLGSGPFAFGLFDWDLHGDRGGGINAILEITGRLDVLGFAGAVLQSAADSVVFTEVLRRFAGNVRDDGPVGYVGQSLGSLIGVLAAATGGDHTAYVLNVGGMGMGNILRTGEVVELLGLRHRVGDAVAAAPVPDLPEDLAIDAVLIASQLGLDFADPATFAPDVSAPVLLQESIGDWIMPNDTTEALARTLGLPLVRPSLREVAGLDTAEAPTGGEPDRGLAQFKVSDVGFEAHLAMQHEPVSTQMLRYLRSFYDDPPDNDGDIAYECNGSCDLVANHPAEPPPPAEPVRHTYPPTDADLPNPERGFYRFVDLVGHPEALGDVRAGGDTLVFSYVRLDDHRDGRLGPELLEATAAGLSAARAAGLKVVLRFAYNEGPWPETEPDAPLEVVLGHIEQLTPLLRAHADVLAVVQAGFVGAWGEWHSSTNGLAEPEARRRVLEALLAAVPPERSVQLRYPPHKHALYGEPPADGDGARVGHHNDCFLASDTDLGTYPDGEVERWKAYLAADTAAVPMGGETCNPAPPRSECVTALAELGRFHFAYLNRDYHPDVLARWAEQGCEPEIRRRLGYRLVLGAATFPERAEAGGDLEVELELRNEGFARPFNPRRLVLALRDGMAPFEVVTDVEWRDFRPGAHRVTLSAALPANLPPGPYALTLGLPDPAPGLAARPDYAARLANDGIWDEALGEHRLGTIEIR